ncbi:MAG: AEC family transporter [Candidatus Latescibacterota bacterium]|jgi:hypothetical protein
MLAVLLVISPLFLVIGLGILLRAVRLADDRWTDVLNRYGLYAGFPALIVKSLTDLPSIEAIPVTAVALNLAGLNLFLFGTYGLARWLGAGRSLAASLAICGTYGNIAYLGLPFIVSVLPGSEATVIAHIAVYLVVLFTSGILLLEHLRGTRLSLAAMALSLLRNPLTLAILVGLALVAGGVRLPVPLAKAIGLVAASASPTVLLSLGIFVGQGVGLDRDLPRALLLTAVKLLALPTLFAAAWLGLGRDPAMQVSVLQAGMPVGLTGFALAQIYPLEQRAVAYAVTLSTVLSALTLPAIVQLL